MKAKTNVYVPVPRFSLNSLWLFIAGILARVNRGYDDYELRGRMGEWTRAEIAQEKADDIANEKYHDMLHEFWGDVS